MKKILVLCIMVFSFASMDFVSAQTGTTNAPNNDESEIKNLTDNLNKAVEEYKADPKNPDTKGKVEKANKELNDAKKKAKDKYEEECNNSGGCFEQPSWTLKVGSFTPGPTFKKSGIKGRADELFGKIIKSLMIVLGVLSVFIMTIGGGYMILHNGQDELLNKGKSIFMAGIISMVIALSSYFLVDIIINILYK